MSSYLSRMKPDGLDPPYMFATQGEQYTPTGLYGCTLDANYKCTDGSFACPYQLYDDGKKGNWRWQLNADKTQCVPPADGTPNGTDAGKYEAEEYNSGLHPTIQRFPAPQWERWIPKPGTYTDTRTPHMNNEPTALMCHNSSKVLPNQGVMINGEFVAYTGTECPGPSVCCSGSDDWNNWLAPTGYNGMCLAPCPHNGGGRFCPNGFTQYPGYGGHFNNDAKTCDTYYPEYLTG